MLLKHNSAQPCQLWFLKEMAGKIQRKDGELRGIGLLVIKVPCKLAVLSDDFTPSRWANAKSGRRVNSKENFILVHQRSGK